MKSAEERAEDIADVLGVRFSSDSERAEVEQILREHALDQRCICAERAQVSISNSRHADIVHAAVMNAPEPGKEKSP